eukprot:TRINITY_DN50714_c0_g1_i1.p1 TRINITY_DN50714_c0_g1~~TRINITY_DN50714_c0_g1_i1.p1  ORF type:complete len:411 (-),score=84.74 TRINITY_DN50714_c0_g1_i1:274-1506(-)
MPSMAAAHRLAARRSAGLASRRALPGTSRNSSFIKQVMEQVKKDMEVDEKKKKDWVQAQRSSERMRMQAERYTDKLGNIGEGIKDASAKTSEVLSGWKEKVKTGYSQVERVTEDSQYLRKARDFVNHTVSTGSASSNSVFSKTRGAFSTVMDATSKAVSYFGDDHTKAERTRQWKASRDASTAAATEEREASADNQAGSNAVPEPETALVVSKAHNSSWERFGASVRDMPFLSSVFENPLFDRVFGESEIAASVREMQELDSSFRMADFAEDIEHVVAPHIIKTFLEGNREALKGQCGEAAFAAVDASIKARMQQKLSLDPNILAGPTEVELKGAKLMDKGPPCFIWTFTMQQINCLRDRNNEIIEGAVDDIRTVCYALAVTRHPDLSIPSLEHPWQISELAILWNQQSF